MTILPPPGAVSAQSSLPVFVVKTKGNAMTAAERQRRCRANGKGRHRGGLSAAQKASLRRQTQAQWAELLAREAAGQAAAQSPAPSPLPVRPGTQLLFAFCADAVAA